MSRVLTAVLAAATAAGVLVVGVPEVGERPAGPASVAAVAVGGHTGVAVAPGSGTVPVPEAGAGGRWGSPPQTESGPRWRWPLAPRPPVLRRFRAPPNRYAAGHRGLDLGAVTDTAVLAVADGRITHAGAVAGRGTVTITHGSGLRSSYEPVDPSVAVGDVVAAGDVIGRLAPGTAVGHCGDRACLHLGARRGDAYVDPWPLLAGGRLALLPLR